MEEKKVNMVCIMELKIYTEITLFYIVLHLYVVVVVDVC